MKSIIRTIKFWDLFISPNHSIFLQPCWVAKTICGGFSEMWCPPHAKLTLWKHGGICHTVKCPFVFVNFFVVCFKSLSQHYKLLCNICTVAASAVCHVACWRLYTTSLTVLFPDWICLVAGDRQSWRVLHLRDVWLLWSPYLIGQTIIFLPCDFYLLSSSFFFFLA